MVGWWFVAAGAVAVGCADLACLFFPQPGPLVVATLSATYQYAGGLRSMRRFGAKPGLLDAGLAVAALGCCCWLALRMGAGSGAWSPAVGYPVLGYVALIAVYDLSRHAWAATWRRHVRPIDHGVKMTGLWFAMLSAGLGNAVPSLRPWSSLGPACLCPLVDVVLIILYLRVRRQAAWRGSGVRADSLVAA